MDTLNKAIIDEKGYYNHLKLTNMTRASIVKSGRVHNTFHTLKKKPNLNIEKSNTCMKCGNAFKKGHLNVCPAKEIICNICTNKGHFGRLCNSKGRRPTVINVEEVVNNQNCSYSPENPQARIDENFCGVIIAWGQKRGLATTTIIPCWLSELFTIPTALKSRNLWTLDREKTQ